MDKYLMGEDISVDEIKDCIRKATINNTMVPVTCGTSYKNKVFRSFWTRSSTICPRRRTFRLSRA